MEILYKGIFVRQLNKLTKDLQDEVLEKIEMFRNRKNHEPLKVHKLHGPFKDCYSFSVNYEYRIIFSYESRKEIVLLAIGKHDLYK